MCLNYDPFKYADEYTSGWEFFLDNSGVNLNEVKEMLKKNLITEEEFEYAKYYLAQKGVCYE